MQAGARVGATVSARSATWGSEWDGAKVGEGYGSALAYSAG